MPYGAGKNLSLRIFSTLSNYWICVLQNLYPVTELDNHALVSYLQCSIIARACKAARAIGLAASCATELEHCTRICDSFAVLMESLRENFR